MTKIEKLTRFHTLLHHLRKQYPIGEGQSTYNNCSNKCGNSVRGTGLCANCCANEMGKLSDDRNAGFKIQTALMRQSEAIGELEDALK